VDARTTHDRSAAPHRGAAEGRREPVRRPWQPLLLRLAVPVLILAAALVLPSLMITTTRPFRGTGLGPGAWPQLMLVLIAVCALAWSVQIILRWWSGRLETAGTEDEAYSYPKAIAGLVLILAYGRSLPLIGFSLASALFIASWCLLGGVRTLIAVVPISLIGTGVLLWLFMGLALMPLPRGVGAFDTISVAILRALGIY
jgi:putative tricarboxylic transport membrane protein